MLIEAFSRTADPDSALAGFDRFLADLPSGVQLFSLLRANPSLMRLIADITPVLPGVDVLVTDYSSIVFDAALVPVPAIFLAPELSATSRMVPI